MRGSTGLESRPSPPRTAARCFPKRSRKHPDPCYSNGREPEYVSSSIGARCDANSVHWRACRAQGARAGDLLPPLLRIELLRVAAGQHLEGALGVALEVHLARRVLMAEPVGRDKVRHQGGSDRIAVAVVLDGIADLAGPEDSLVVLVGAVQPGIDRHLADLVGGAHADAGLVRQNGLDEDFRDRQPFIGQVVVSERVGLVPDRVEVLVPLGVEGGKHLLHIEVIESGGFFNHCQWQHRCLLAVRVIPVVSRAHSDTPSVRVLRRTKTRLLFLADADRALAERPYHFLSTEVPKSHGSLRALVLARSAVTSKSAARRRCKPRCFSVRRPGLKPARPHETVPPSITES